MMTTELGLFNGKTKKIPSFQELLSETCNSGVENVEIRVQNLELMLDFMKWISVGEGERSLSKGKASW